GVKDEDGADGLGSDTGPAVKEDTESRAAEDADADDARADAGRTEEKKEEQDSNSSKTTNKSSKSEDCSVCRRCFVCYFRLYASSVHLEEFLFCSVRIK
ncbi:uncharacterized, partial [Tachysurus ichikawai]